MAIPQHRLDIFAVGFAEAVGPEITAENFNLSVFGFRSIKDCAVENSAISSAVTSALRHVTGHV